MKVKAKTYNDKKKLKKFGPKNTPEYYVKYKNPANAKKTFMKLKNVRGIAKVTHIARKQVNINMSVPEEHCFENRIIKLTMRDG